MAHFSEMDFLFSSQDNKDSVTQQLAQTSLNNNFNIFKGSPSYVVYKRGRTSGNAGEGTANIKNYLKEKVYNNENTKNPYVKLLEDFNKKNGQEGAALRIKAADLAYLRELGVHPINRMAILRRYKDGVLVPENLEELAEEPISTIVGWIKPDQNFGNIGFGETWETTNNRFDILLNNLVQRNFGLNISAIVPIPDFAQGVLFEFYNKAGLATGPTERSTNEQVESFNGSNLEKNNNDWGLTNIPVGDPNVLKEGPFRNTEVQNIKSNFEFELTTTYEQKLLGDVDPGSAMLDILDNIYAMGTSNMVFYWNEDSGIVAEARKAAISNEGKGNDLGAWWRFISEMFKQFWENIVKLFNNVKDKVEEVVQKVVSAKSADDIKNIMQGAEEKTKTLLQSVLTSTLSIHRFEIKGSIELMTGGKYSSTPWYLTIGNPYSPWLATNHIVIRSCSIETSTEMGFNDQPQYITAKFNCQFSRSLGKQELMRMFNNTYRRTYASPVGKMTAMIPISKAKVSSNSTISNPGLMKMNTPVVNQNQNTPAIPDTPNDIDDFEDFNTQYFA